MNKLWILLKIELLGYVNLPCLLHSQNKKGKRTLALYAAGGTALLLVCASYSALIAFGCVQLGLADVLPGMLVFVSALVTLLFTFLKSGGILFGFRNYDQVMSLPVKTDIIVASRILSLYLGNLLFVLAACLPVSLVYGTASSISAAAWCMLLLSLLFLPMLPMALSMLLSACLNALSVRFRHRNLVVILGSLLLLVVLFAGSFRLKTTDVSELAAFGTQLQEMLLRYYPPAAWLSASVSTSAPDGFLLFAAASAGCLVLFACLLTCFYKSLNSALSSHRRRQTRRQQKNRTYSPFLAVYRKELRQLFSCPVYLLNSSIGAFLLMALALLAAFFGLDRAAELMELPAGMGELSQLLPWISLFFIGLSSTTASSVSLEGKSLWIIKTAPVEPTLVYRAKVAVNLTVLLPAVLISAAAACRIMPVTPISLFTLLAVPAGYALLTALFGLFLNLKRPWYDWNYEYQPVKQSFPVFVSIFAGMPLSLSAIAAACLALRQAQAHPAVPFLCSALFCALCLAASLALWRKIRRQPLPDQP